MAAREIKTKACGKCANPISNRSRSELCKKCVPRLGNLKYAFSWPPDEELLQMHETLSFEDMGKQLNINSATVRHRVRKIEKNLTI